MKNKLPFGSGPRRAGDFSLGWGMRVVDVGEGGGVEGGIANEGPRYIQQEEGGG